VNKSLIKNGRIDITIDDTSQVNWILVLAKKPYE
jgi:hypothetical protein